MWNKKSKKIKINIYIPLNSNVGWLPKINQIKINKKLTFS